MSFNLRLPCWTTAAWAEMAREGKYRPVDSRVDDDGDIWAIWARDDGAWRSTITVEGGKVTCVLGVLVKPSGPPA